MKKNYNNGKECKRFEEGQQPVGWVLGNLPRSEEDKERSNEKRRQTNLERYGSSAPLGSEEIKEKAKQTNLKRYGVENPSQSKEVKEKRTQTFINKYGVSNPMQSEEVQERLYRTNLEKYGVGNTFASKEVQEQIKKTNIEHYGTEYPMQSKEVQEKSKQTLLKNYGVSNPLKSKEIKEKVLQTNNERYGGNSPLVSEDVKQKAIETLKANYGVENPMYSEEVKEHLKQTNQKRYGVDFTFQSDEVKKKVSETCKERYGYTWACMRPEARMGYSNDSVPNKEFASLLDTNNIQYEREFPIGKYSYDFKVGNILIEINPFATHNSIWDPFGGNGITETYHQKKSQNAEKQGYQVIHIFDWDDTNKVINLLKTQEKVYARKCKVSNVTQDEMVEFENKYHLQGYCRGQGVCIGLYYNEELVSLMTFGKPRYNKNYQWELLRYCSSKNVVGGAKKLFKHFIKEQNPESIISYCDRSKFQGKVYTKIGFKLKSDGSPSCHWYSPKDNNHITDNLLRDRGFDQLFNTNYGKGTSNEELMIEHGFVPIYDCGQAVYEWRCNK